MDKLAGIAFGMPYPIRRPTELPAAKLHELEGVYRIGANALRRISVKGNGLIVQRSGGPESIWHPDAADEFYVVDGVSTFRAIRNSAGLVTGINFFDWGEGEAASEPKTDEPFGPAGQ